jgi:two-component system, NtrC family, sensor kinase
MLMQAQFLTFILYLFYGLAFFTMGVAILSKLTRGSNLEIARYLWLFCLYAFTHACHEWLSLFFIFTANHPFYVAGSANWIFLLPITASYIFLLLFGLRVQEIVRPGWKPFLRIVPFGLMAILIVIVVSRGYDPTPEFYDFVKYRIRNLIGLPAGTISGLGLILYSSYIKKLSARGTRTLFGAGVFLVLYGVLTGLVPAGSSVPFLGIPIEWVRGMNAAFILYFLMNALHIFDLEQNSIIEQRLQRVAHSEKLSSVGKLAAGIAHEINNPLTNVSLNVEMLKKDVLSDANRKTAGRRFEAIERNLDRASKIARELLYFSRHKEADFIRTDLNDVVRRTLTLLAPHKKNYDIRYLPGRIPAIMGIPWKLEEVFLNIITNAMEATTPGGEITITTRAEETSIFAEITDTGVGITEENLKSIFDPFFTTKDVGMGTGLGLSICFGIMERHGGRISVTSKQGQGTTFSLVFPLGDN